MLRTICGFKSMGNVQDTELISRRWLSPKAFEIELTRPPALKFRAGQTIRFHHGDLQRDYAIVSATDEATLVLCVRYIKQGPFTNILAKAAVGDRFKITGPHGYFTFNPSRRPAVFVATGTGIAPFVSMARSGVTGFTLLHGVTYAEDLYYESFLRRITTDYIPCLSEPVSAAKLPEGAFQGMVTDHIGSQLPRGEYDFYLCGRGEMVRDATLLVDEFFPGSLVYHEVFFQDYSPE